MKKNDELQVNIEGYSSDGAGIAKPDGFVLFIPGTIRGERILAHITKVNKNFGYARAMDILTPSEKRIPLDCPKATACGGCQLRHMSYDEQLYFKRQKVAGNMQKAGIECPVDPCVPSPRLTGYRNKAQFPIREQDGKITGGFYRRGSHTVIECDCVIQPDIFNKILKKTIEFMEKGRVPAYNEISGKGTVRHLYLRGNSDFSSIMLCLVVKGEFALKKQFAELLSVQFPEISTVCINYNNKNTNVVLGERYETVLGDGYIKDTLLSKTFKISPESFYQVNHDGCEKLYSVVKEFAKGSKNLLDLYCGIGTIGICVGDEAGSLTGIEIVEKAVQNAKENAIANKVQNASFAAMDANVAKDFAKEYYDTIIVDPPRKGCDGKTLDYLTGKAPEKLIYVSCDCATLARDLRILTENGFQVQKITPVDMFPGTNHVETVALLSRQSKEHKMKLNPAPFMLIKSGAKTIELRLYDEKRQKIKTGDKIVFTNTVTGETLGRTVVKLHRFDSFEKLYESLPLLKCGYTVNDVENAKPSDMEQYYSAKEQNKYGVIGIELCKDTDF